jgi:hypothetical protein
MSHAHHDPRRAKRHHPGTGGGARFSGSHVAKLLLLNCVLFLACGAFAGAIVGDYIEDKLQMRVLAAFVLVPIGIAIVSTFIHVRASRWTSVDSMSERMFGGRPDQER